MLRSVLLGVFTSSKPVEDSEKRQDDVYMDRVLEDDDDHQSDISSDDGFRRKAKALMNNRPRIKDDLDAYIPNYRYMPIVSGVVIPFSILLHIPALTDNWYIRTVENKTVENRPNSTLLRVGMGFSIGCALLANIALVARYSEVKVKIMTIICVVLLSIHDIINITTLLIFGLEHRVDDGFTYGHSYWMTVCSTVASTFTNITLLVDLYRTPAFSKSGSGLSRKQRSLVIMVIVLLCYIAFGSLVHASLIHLSFINALYFTVVSIETIGFGDITLPSAGARVFTCLYSVIGILVLALAVGMTRETVLEGLEVGYRKRMEDLRVKRNRTRWALRVTERWKHAVEWRLKESGHPVFIANNPERSSIVLWATRLFDYVFPWQASHGKWFGKQKYLGDVAHPHRMHLNLEALSNAQLEAAAMETGVPLETVLPSNFERPKDRESDSEKRQENGTTLPVEQPRVEDIPLTHARIGRIGAMLGRFAFAVDRSTFFNTKAADTDGETTDPIVNALDQNSQDNLETFRLGVEREEKKALNARLVVVWLLFVAFWTVGSAVFMRTEGWSFGIAVYFCFICFMTIGYGDYSPKTPAGRSFFVAWALLGVATMTILISVISEAYSSQYKSAIHSRVFDHAVEKYRAEREAKANKARTRRRNQRPKAPNDASDAQPAGSTSHSRIHDQLAKLPYHVLEGTKSFQEHMQYFIDRGRGQTPETLKQMLNEIMRSEKLSGRSKHEIMQDEQSKHTLLTLSIEKSLSKMIEAAEDAIFALEERDSLLESRHNDDEIAIVPRQETRL